MLNYFLFSFIFLITLFIYIHIIYHYKISNDLEIYDINDINNINIDEILDLRQPISIIDEKYKPLNDVNIDELINYFPVFDLNLWKCENVNFLINKEPNIIVMKDIITTFKNNKELLSIQNSDFLKDSGLYQKINNALYDLKPKLCSNTNIDLIMMSKDSYIPLQYNLDYRHYIIVTQGEFKLKLIPPKNIKYLHKEDDYLNFMFYSKINPWNIQENYKKDFDKVISLDLILKKNDIVYIPSYWWYSLQSNSNLSLYVDVKYGTYMNYFSNIYHYFIHILQKQNIKYNFLPKKMLNYENINSYLQL